MTWFALKVIALISMTLDHAASIFLTQPFLTGQLGMSLSGSAHLREAMRLAGRVAFPIYAFGIAQGCARTKNRNKLLLRLRIFAVLAEVPYQLSFNSRLRFFPLSIENVLFTLLFGAFSCYIYDFFHQKKKAWIAVFPILFLVLAAEICHSDYGGIGVLCVFLPYLFRDKKWLQLGSLAAMLLILYFFQPYVLSHSPLSLHALWTNLSALAGVGLLALYNGRQGRASKFFQYFFYAYYPLHLLVFYGIARWTGTLVTSVG